MVLLISYSMSNHLTIVSILLLLFYMAWFMWDQNKLIHNQRDQIKQLEMQSFYDAIIIQHLRAKQNQPLYQQNDNPI
jgi:hypothetical protein